MNPHSHQESSTFIIAQHLMMPSIEIVFQSHYHKHDDENDFKLDQAKYS